LGGDRGTVRLSLNPRGTDEIEGTGIKIKIEDKFLTGTIKKGEITFNTSDGGVAVYKNDAYPSNLSIIGSILLAIWIIFVIIQGFLAYGLTQREVLREGKKGNGETLMNAQAYYGLLSLIPGVVIYLWYQERQVDKILKKDKFE